MQALAGYRRVDTQKRSLVIASAMVAALAVPLVTDSQAGSAPKPKFDSEKCYGISKAGKNELPYGQPVLRRNLTARRSEGRLHLRSGRDLREGGPLLA